MELNFKHKISVHLLNLISRTWRIKLIGKLPDYPCIVGFWHGLMLPGWLILSKKSPVAVVSQSKDGSILSALLKLWGYTLVRGSSSKDGDKVLKELIELANHRFIAITPDGPGGPIYKLKPGIVVSAVRASAPVIFLGIEIKSKIIFRNSWDRFQLPLPFSGINITVSEPIIYKKESSKDEINEYILNSQNLLTQLNRNVIDI